MNQAENEGFQQTEREAMAKQFKRGAHDIANTKEKETPKMELNYGKKVNLRKNLNLTHCMFKQSYDDRLDLGIGKTQIKEFYQGGVADEEIFDYEHPKVDFNPMKLEEHDFFGELESNTKKSNIKSYFTVSSKPFDKITVKPVKKSHNNMNVAIRKKPPIQNKKDNTRSRKQSKNKLEKSINTCESELFKGSVCLGDLSLINDSGISPNINKTRVLPQHIAEKARFQKR